MASYSLLNAFSGFEFNAVEGMIGFHPVLTANGTFQSFWSLESGWGSFKSDLNNVELQELKGTLSLSTFKLPEDWLTRLSSIQFADNEVSFQLAADHIHFPTALALDESHRLTLRLISAR